MRTLRRRRSHALCACTLALACIIAGTASASADQMGYVTDSSDNTVTPIDLTTGTTGAPFAVGTNPAAVAITPDGGTMLVANNADNTVTPVTIASNATGLTFTAGTPIAAGPNPKAIAVTADGMTAYVADDGSNTVTPITLEGIDVPGTPLTVASGPNAIALTPNGELAYVTSDSGWVTPIITSTNGISRTPPAIHVGSNPDSIAISPDGNTGYITDSTSGTITRFQIPSDNQLDPINVGSTPNALAITPDGTQLWVANNIASSGTAQYALTEVSLPSGTVGAAIALPSQPSSITISADGSTAYVTEYGDNEVLPVDLAAGTVGAPITVGNGPSDFTLAPETGSGSGSGGSGSGYTFPVSGHQSGNLGNHGLSLTTSGTTNSPTAACLAPTGNLRSRLTAKSLKHGIKLRFVSATFRLGRHSKRVRRLPASVRLSLKGLASGVQVVTVKVTYRQRLGGRTRYVTKTLRNAFKIC